MPNHWFIIAILQDMESRRAIKDIQVNIWLVTPQQDLLEAIWLDYNYEAAWILFKKHILDQSDERYLQ